MIYINTATKIELETEICCDKSLYALVDEAKFLAEEYTVEELREIIGAWVEANDECSGS